MSIPPSDIRYLEIDLVSRGYAQRFWRRGIMGTRVFAKDQERVVIVRNIGVDRRPEDNHPPTIENWFVRLQAVLDGMLRGARVTDLILCGEATVQVPQGFLDWCRSQGIQPHTEQSSLAGRSATSLS